MGVLVPVYSTDPPSDPVPITWFPVAVPVPGNAVEVPGNVVDVIGVVGYCDDFLLQNQIITYCDKINFSTFYYFITIITHAPLEQVDFSEQLSSFHI
jgi:hypothetical protein